MSRVEDFGVELGSAVDIRRLDKIDRATIVAQGDTGSVRLYCTQAAETWCLQVRGPLLRARGGAGPDFVVASASMSMNALRALRDSIDQYLAEAAELVAEGR